MRESQVWEQSVQHIGRVPENCQWISVSDSGSDVYTGGANLRGTGLRFCAPPRGIHRNVDRSEAEVSEQREQAHLKTQVRTWPAVDAQVITIPAQRGRPKRDTRLQMTFQEVRVHPPLHGARLSETGITAWVVRVWETTAPEGQEPLEWIFLTTLPLTHAEQAWEVVQWYEWRGPMEDFHKALKTDCQLERHQLQTIEAIWRLLAILTPLALRLLVIRQAAQHAEDIPATNVVDAETLQVVFHLDQRHRVVRTAKELWRAIARLGGYLDRKNDGPLHQY